MKKFLYLGEGAARMVFAWILGLGVYMNPNILEDMFGLALKNTIKVRRNTIVATKNIIAVEKGTIVVLKKTKL